MIFQPAKLNYWAVKDAKGVIAGYGETQPGEITYVNPEYALVTAPDLTILAGLLKVSLAGVQAAAFGLNRKGLEGVKVLDKLPADQVILVEMGPGKYIPQ